MATPTVQSAATTAATATPTPTAVLPTATPTPSFPPDVEKAASDIERMLKLGDDSWLALSWLIGAKWQIKGDTYLESRQGDAEEWCQEVLSTLAAGQPADLWPREYTTYRDTLYTMCGAFYRFVRRLTASPNGARLIAEDEHAKLRERRAALPDYSAAQLRRALLARK